MKKPPLIIKNLSKTFNDQRGGLLNVLQDISLVLEGGEIISILGPSGCGKSTLLDCAAGLTIPDYGSITTSSEVSYMTQNTCMFPWRTIIENVRLPLEIQGFLPSVASKRAEQLLVDFQMEQWADYFPDMLSGGMLQRISLLRAHIGNKKIMLLDEPFGKLDALTKIQVQQWFLEIMQKTNTSVLFVTHDIDEAIFISDRIFVLSAQPGKIKAEIVVSFARPRTIDMMTTIVFATFKRKIVKILRA